MTVLCMGLIFAFMAYIMLCDTKITDTSAHLFNYSNTTVLRGFWSLVVILVHIPAAYQNRLQDMVGSFAYIGVTFFFLVSAYGLKKSAAVHGVKGFWRRRLPKLLVPMFVVNIVEIFVNNKIWDIMWLPLYLPFYIDTWVQWLLICYFIFWLTYRIEGIKQKDIWVSMGIIAVSLYRYVFISDGGWPTEIFGFIWGLLLANGKMLGQKKATTKTWLYSCAILCAGSLAVGVLYLQYKFVAFWGDYLLKIFLGFLLLGLLICINKRVDFGNKIGLWLGGISYEIYLTHTLVMRWLADVKITWLSGPYIITVVILTIAFALLANKISNFILKNRLSEDCRKCLRKN